MDMGNAGSKRVFALAIALAAALVCRGGAAAESDGVYRVQGKFSAGNPPARCFVDVPFRHDMTLARSISFDISVENAAGFSGFTCYLRSGGGWYRTYFQPGFKGAKKRVTIEKKDFDGIENSPGSWRQVDLVRISGSRLGTNDAAFVVSSFSCDFADTDIAVIQAHGNVGSGGRERDGFYIYARSLAETLQSIGLEPVVVSDTDFDSAVAARMKCVFLPYNPKLPDSTVEALKEHAARHGKIFAAYNCDRRVLQLLGFRQWTAVKPPAGGTFTGFVRADDALEGQPQFVPQSSWVTIVPKTHVPMKTVAWWADPSGKKMDIPAIMCGDAGTFIGHVWKSSGHGDKEAQKLMGAIVLSMCPEKRDAIERQAAAAEAKRLADEAYVKSMPSVPGEFRAFWCHSPRGLGDGRSWDESVAVLKKGGFNTLIANLAWGTFASYPSKVLPYSAEAPDSFAECKAACRKHGVKLHVWNVCWRVNANGTPKEFQDRLAAEGRLQRTFKGEDSPWLCPTHPENLKLETEAMVELASMRPDGIHFDYIRYPNKECCFCDGCRARFEKKYGTVDKWPDDIRKIPARRAQWDEFRCSAISALVSGVADRVRREYPGVEISAAVFRNFFETKETVAQDWISWCRDGLLDFVCPMDYINSAEIFAETIMLQKKELGDFRIYPGIGLSSTHADPSGRLRRVAEQIGICRKCGFGGYTVFNFNQPALEVLPILSLGPTRP